MRFLSHFSMAVALATAGTLAVTALPQDAQAAKKKKEAESSIKISKEIQPKVAAIQAAMATETPATAKPLVEALLRHGADPNVRLATGTPQRRTSADWAFDPALVSATPYWLAAYYREPNIMRDLVAAGADPRLTTLELWRPVYPRAGGVGPPHMAGGFVPPGVAVIRGDSGRRRFFLDETIRDPNVGEREALAAFKVALEFGADVDATDHNGDAAIHRAAQRNLTTVVRLLAQRAADINLLDGSGRSALQLADAAAAGRLRSQVAAARAPSGNTADVLRELGAIEPEQK